MPTTITFSNPADLRDLILAANTALGGSDGTTQALVTECGGIVTVTFLAVAPANS